LAGKDDPILVAGGGLGGASVALALAAGSTRTDEDGFDCLAWLCDGFALPQRRGAAA
jgi:hypothetical protein